MVVWRAKHAIHIIAIYVIVKYAYIVTAQTSNTENLEQNINAEESLIYNNGVIITQPAESIIFQEVGRLYPSINTAHIRFTINTEDILKAKDEICNSVNKIENMYNYTEFQGDSSSGIKASYEALDATNKAKYPSVTYKLTINGMHSKVIAACSEATAEYELMMSIVYAEPISVTHARNTRGILDAISLIWSGYNSYQIRELSSEAAELRNNQKHLLVALQGVTEATRNMQKQVTEIGTVFDQMKAINEVRHFELKICNFLETIEQKNGKLLQYIIRMSEGLYEAIGGNLSPKIIDPVTMRQALADLVNMAMRRGYSSITNIITHVFEFPTSFYKVPNTANFDVIVHLLMYHKEESMYCGKEETYLFHFL